MWKLVSLFLFVLLTTSSSLPLDSDHGRSTPRTVNLPTLATELQPPRGDAEVASYSAKIVDESNSKLSTDLEPPSEDAEIGDFGVENIEPTISTELEPPSEDAESFHKLGSVFIINLFAIKNATTSEETNEILTDEFAEQNPTVLEPIATVLLVLEEDDEDKPVSLDDLAKDLEQEGFKVEKIGDGETKLIKIDMDEIDNDDSELIKPGKLSKVRRRRTLGHGGGLLSKLFDKHNGGGCQGGCGGCQGNCGGGYPQNTGSVGYIPLVVVQQQPQQHYQPPPQQHYQPPPQQHYQPPPQQHYRPQPNYQPQPHYQQPSGGCNTCGGGNHGSYSQASAQSSSQSW